jgi:5-methylcytosine-specific restriction enzyme A
MTRVPHLCTCGCGKFIPYGEKCERQKAAATARKARHDARRPTARERGYNHEWRKARLEYLADHPHCRMCAEAGRVRTATVVDHIIPHKGNDRLFWFRGNWQPLCEPCHNSTKQKQERSQ